MKRHLLITLTAITAVALVTAPGWAAGGRVLSDRQLDGVHAGWSDPVSDAHSADSSADSSSSGSFFVAGAASSAAAATASDVASALAVKINNKCDSSGGDCELKIFDDVKNNGSSTGTNAQSILNTVGSVSAVQINVSVGGGTQENMAYSAQGAIGEIDSADDAAASAASDAALVGSSFVSADSSASSAASSASTLAFATPRVEVKNRCGASGECKLKIFDDVKNNGNSTATNAQSIVNTVASVSAVQINVAGTTSTLQSNIAFSTLSPPTP